MISRKERTIQQAISGSKTSIIPAYLFYIYLLINGDNYDEEFLLIITCEGKGRWAMKISQC